VRERAQSWRELLLEPVRWRIVLELPMHHQGRRSLASCRYGRSSATPGRRPETGSSAPLSGHQCCDRRGDRGGVDRADDPHRTRPNSRWPTARALGFWQPIVEVWPKTGGRRCWEHQIANVLNKVPTRAAEQERADVARARRHCQPAFSVAS